MGLKFSTLSTSVSKSSLEAPGPSTGVPAGGTEGEAGAAVRAASVTVQAHLHQNFRISRVSVFLETCGSLLPIIDEVQTGHSSSSRSSSFRSLASAMTEIRLDLFREENLDFFLFHLYLLIQFIKYLLRVIKKVCIQIENRHLLLRKTYLKVIKFHLPGPGAYQLSLKASIYVAPEENLENFT